MVPHLRDAAAAAGPRPLTRTVAIHLTPVSIRKSLVRRRTTTRPATATDLAQPYFPPSSRAPTGAGEQLRAEHVLPRITWWTSGTVGTPSWCWTRAPRNGVADHLAFDIVKSVFSDVRFRSPATARNNSERQ